MFYCIRSIIRGKSLNDAPQMTRRKIVPEWVVRPELLSGYVLLMMAD
ncbi:hypothetical protein [Microcoleus sp. D3_18a_C4]